MRGALRKTHQLGCWRLVAAAGASSDEVGGGGSAKVDADSKRSSEIAPRKLDRVGEMERGSKVSLTFRSCILGQK